MNFPPLDHPKTCACAICTGALALEDCASLRIVDVVELRKLMAGVQAGFAHASRRRIYAVTPNGVLADEVERARSLALAAAHAELQARLPNVPVFLGAP